MRAEISSLDWVSFLLFEPGRAVPAFSIPHMHTLPHA